MHQSANSVPKPFKDYSALCLVSSMSLHTKTGLLYHFLVIMDLACPFTPCHGCLNTVMICKLTGTEQMEELSLYHFT